MGGRGRRTVHLVPWWAWTLIWTGLVLALLIMLGFFAWWLFRKFVVLMDDVATLADKSAILEVADPDLVRPQLAVLASIRDIQNRESARTAHRSNRRRLRWEARLARGRRITATDASTMQWPNDWYPR